MTGVKHKAGEDCPLEESSLAAIKPSTTSFELIL